MKKEKVEGRTKKNNEKRNVSGKKKIVEWKKKQKYKWNTFCSGDKNKSKTDKIIKVMERKKRN